MKNYQFIYFIFFFLIAFGCSDKKTPPSKTQDSPKSVAAPITKETDNKPLKKQDSKVETTPQPVSSSTPSNISGVKSRVSGGYSAPHVSGIQHISGQTRHSSSVSGAQAHISGRIPSARISGQ